MPYYKTLSPVSPGPFSTFNLPSKLPEPDPRNVLFVMGVPLVSHAQMSLKLVSQFKGLTCV